MTGERKEEREKRKGPNGRTAAELLFSFLFYLFSFAFVVDPEKTWPSRSTV
jgi:hypothetical protein